MPKNRPAQSNSISALIDSHEERKQLDLIRQKRKEMDEAIEKYLDVKIDFEVRKNLSEDILPRHLNLKYRTDIRTEAFVISFIQSKSPIGAKLGEIYIYVTKNGKEVSKEYITTLLGRLKKAGKIRREQGGYWMTN